MKKTTSDCHNVLTPGCLIFANHDIYMCIGASSQKDLMWALVIVGSHGFELTRTVRSVNDNELVVGELISDTRAKTLEVNV